MGVVLHGLTHDICHLIVATILDTLHGVKDTTLHRFETISQVGHSTLQDNIRGIVQEPVLVHTREAAHAILCRGQRTILTLRSIYDIVCLLLCLWHNHLGILQLSILNFDFILCH